MFKKIASIINCDSRDLRVLAKAAGANPRTFWRNANLRGVDLRGLDLRDLDLEHAELDGAVYDVTTLFPLSVKLRLARQEKGQLRNHNKHRNRSENRQHSTVDSRVPKPSQDTRSLSSKISVHIPYLRRYARALSGSSATGDAYVASVLESLIADPKMLDNGLDLRVGLYKIFNSLWGSVEFSSTDDRYEGGVDYKYSESPFKRISSIQRQALLLINVEGFSSDEAAQILDMKTDVFSQILSEAIHEIGRLKPAKVLIMEDEPVIAMDIEHLIRGMGHNVTGVARTQAEALELFDDQKPDLILADIKLADGSSGIDAVKIMTDGNSISKIFVTAYPEKLLIGDRPEPAYLLTKPFTPELLQVLVFKALYGGVFEFEEWKY